MDSVDVIDGQVSAVFEGGGLDKVVVSDEKRIRLVSELYKDFGESTTRSLGSSSPHIYFSCC